jgi:hypothetical protein
MATASTAKNGSHSFIVPSLGCGYYMQQNANPHSRGAWEFDMAQTIRLVSWSELAAGHIESEAASIPPSIDEGRRKLLLEMARTEREKANPNRCQVVDEVS